MSDMVTVRFSAEMSFLVSGLKEPYTFDFSKVPDDKKQYIVEGLLNYSLRQTLSDAANKGTDAEKKKAVEAKRDKLQDGTFTFGAGGGRSATDPVDKAWVAYFVALGTKVSEKVVSATNLEQAQKMLCAQEILKMEPEAKDTIVAQVEARFEAWKTYWEEKDSALATMIQGEKAKAAIKQKPTAHVAPKGAF